MADEAALEGLCVGCLLGYVLETVVLDREVTAETHELAGVEALFPDLEIISMLGRGGMGLVYKARQLDLDRVIALKILDPELGKQAAFQERFLQEARAMARLEHPNIVRLLDYGQRGALYYLFLEYVDGADLRGLLNSDTLQPRRALTIVPQICDALGYAHDMGIVHRDIKPENILIDSTGRIRITDFGLAKLVTEEDTRLRLTATGTFMGTPYYVAPEQVGAPQEVDQRADIYSLGVVFYELLTGDLPLGNFEPPSAKTGIRADLDEVVLKSLEQEPRHRFQHASELKVAVAKAVAGPTGSPDWHADASRYMNYFAIASLLAALLVCGWAHMTGWNRVFLEIHQDLARKPPWAVWVANSIHPVVCELGVLLAIGLMYWKESWMRAKWASFLINTVMFILPWGVMLLIFIAELVSIGELIWTVP